MNAVLWLIVFPLIAIAIFVYEIRNHPDSWAWTIVNKTWALIEKQSAYHPVRLALCVAIIVFIIVMILSTWFGVYKDFKDVLVEAHGLVFDLFVVSAFMFWLTRLGEKRLRIQRYQEEINDYLGWDEKEAMYRIRGNIKRLNRDDGDLPSLEKAFLEKVDLPGANLRNAYMWYANLKEADLRKADLRGAKLIMANLSGADLKDADLRGTHFGSADLSGVRLHGSIIDESTRFDDKWLLVWQIVNQESSGLDLSNEDLSGAYLQGVDLSNTKLIGADLSNTILSGTDLNASDLSRADLRNAVLFPISLGDTNLSNANLSSVSLKHHILTHVNLSGSDLRDTDLEGANLKYAMYSRETQWPEKFNYKQSGAIGPGADFRGVDLATPVILGNNRYIAPLNKVDIRGAIYDSKTVWPEGFDPIAAGAERCE